VSESSSEVVGLWAEAWSRLDTDAVARLFADDATYVAALSGEVSDLRRAFRVAGRAWAECRIDGLEVSVVSDGGDVVVVAATYRFTGTTRRGAEVAYDAAATFVLRRAAGRWLIVRYHESFRGGGAPAERGAR